jgi:hypothetical protein
MNIARMLAYTIVVVVMATWTSADTITNGSDTWSIATNGLQARLTLVEQPKRPGSHWLVPFLELRNARNLADQMEVLCDNEHLKIELVDVDGKVIRSGWKFGRSGMTAELGTIVLPVDSSIRISLECENWGLPENAAAVVATDSGAWIIQESEKGKVYLRATLKGEEFPMASNRKAWSGKLQAPLLKIDWN